jgi:hypothetical protein
MQLKIKTPDIELEYTDEYSIIEEAAKKRILEIINQIHTHQIGSKPFAVVSAYDAFGELKTDKP